MKNEEIHPAKEEEAGKKENNQESVKSIEEPQSRWDKAKEIFTNEQIGNQALKTTAETVASITGVKSLFDVPAYLHQRFKVRGMFGKGKGIDGSVKELLTSSEDKTDRVGRHNLWAETEKLKNDQTISPEEKEERMTEIDNKLAETEPTKVREAIKDLNDRLALTKEGSQKGSEQRNLIAKVLRERRAKEQISMDEVQKKMDGVLDDYTTTKVSGMQAARESLNTVLVASGAMSARGAAYGIMDMVERKQRLDKEAKNEGLNLDEKYQRLGDKNAESTGKEVSWVKDVLIGSIKETFQEAVMQGQEGKTTLQKSLNFVKAWGKIARYAGIGSTMSLRPEAFGHDMDKVLETFSGKASFGDVANNFQGNIDRTIDGYKNIANKINPFSATEANAGEHDPKITAASVHEMPKAGQALKFEVRAGSGSSIEGELIKSGMSGKDAHLSVINYIKVQHPDMDNAGIQKEIDKLSHIKDAKFEFSEGKIKSVNADYFQHKATAGVKVEAVVDHKAPPSNLPHETIQPKAAQHQVEKITETKPEAPKSETAKVEAKTANHPTAEHIQEPVKANTIHENIKYETLKPAAVEEAADIQKPAQKTATTIHEDIPKKTEIKYEAPTHAPKGSGRTAEQLHQMANEAHEGGDRNQEAMKVFENRGASYDEKISALKGVLKDGERVAMDGFELGRQGDKIFLMTGDNKGMLITKGNIDKILDLQAKAKGQAFEGITDNKTDKPEVRVPEVLDSKLLGKSNTFTSYDDKFYVKDSGLKAIVKLEIDNAGGHTLNVRGLDIDVSKEDISKFINNERVMSAMHASGLDGVGQHSLSNEIYGKANDIIARQKILAYMEGHGQGKTPVAEALRQDVHDSIAGMNKIYGQVMNDPDVGRANGDGMKKIAEDITSQKKGIDAKDITDKAHDVKAKVESETTVAGNVRTEKMSAESQAILEGVRGNELLKTDPKEGDMPWLTHLKIGKAGAQFARTEATSTSRDLSANLAGYKQLIDRGDPKAEVMYKSIQEQMKMADKSLGEGVVDKEKINHLLEQIKNKELK